MTALSLASITPRERAVVELFRRHPVLTPGAAGALAELDHPVADLELGERLRQSGWVDVLRPHPTVEWWTPSPKAVAALGVPPGGRVGGVEWAIQQLGLMHLCAANRLRRVDRDEFRTTFPELHRPGLPRNGYAVASDGRLCWLIVDHGSAVERVARRAARVIQRRCQLPGFRGLMAWRRFTVFVGMAEPARAEAVREAVRFLPATNAAPIRVLVVPELQPFLHRPQRSSDSSGAGRPINPEGR